MRTARYSMLQRLVHWAVAISVLGLLAVGFLLGTLGFETTRDTFGLEVTNALYKYHKSFGVLVLGLMVLRLGLWVAHGRPPLPSDLPLIQRFAAQSVQWSLYALLFLQPVVGWVATAAGGYPIEFFGWVLPGLIDKDPALSEWLYQQHWTLGLVILGLVTLHVSAAVYHWKIRRDAVIHRITVP